MAREQTVEVPRSVVRDAFVEHHILGKVESVEIESDGSALATIAFPVESTALDPAQLLNVLFGMTSLHADDNSVCSSRGCVRTRSGTTDRWGSL